MKPIATRKFCDLFIRNSYLKAKCGGKKLLPEEINTVTNN